MGGRKGSGAGRGPAGAKQDAQAAEGAAAAAQRAELIKAYLQQRLGTEQQPAAGAAAGGEAGGGEAGEAGQAASPAQAASPEFVQRLLAEARVPCSDLRVVLRKGAAHLPKDKVEALLEAERLLGLHGPVWYQDPAKALAVQSQGKRRPSEISSQWGYDLAVCRSLLGSQSLGLEAAAKAAKFPGSACGAALAAVQLTRAGEPLDKVAATTLADSLHGALPLKAQYMPMVPSASALAPAPPDAAAAAASGAEQLAAVVMRALHQSVAGASEAADASPRDSFPITVLWHRLERSLQLLRIGSGIADGIVEEADATQFFQRISRYPSSSVSNPALGFGEDLEAAVRGHLLLQLQEQAADAGLVGCPPELQALVQPLAACIEGDGALLSLLQLACSRALHAGVDCNAVHNLGSFACETDVPERGVLWRVLLLLLPLLGMEDPPAAGAGAGAGADAAQAEAASLPLPFTGEADEAGGQDTMLARVSEAHRRAAARLGSAAWQRRLAARVLAALARMQARCRLPEDPLETIVSFLANEGQLQEREATALLCQLSRLPLNHLLPLYAYVVVVFGRAFSCPEDLGNGTSALQELHGKLHPGLTGADFSAASALYGSGLTWSGSGRASELGLSPQALQAVLHARHDPVGEGEDVPPAHVAHTWCPSCGVASPPNTPAADCVEAVAGLAGGTLPMPAAAAAGSLEDDAAVALRLVRGDSVLASASGQVVVRGRQQLDPETLYASLKTMVVVEAAALTLGPRLGAHLRELSPTLACIQDMVQSIKQGKGLPHTSADELRVLSQNVGEIFDLEKLRQLALLLLEQLDMAGDAARLQLGEGRRLVELRALGARLVGEDQAQDWAARQEMMFQHRIQVTQRDMAAAELMLAAKPKELCSWAAELAVVLGLLAAAAERHDAASSPFAAWEPPPALLGKLLAAEGPMQAWVAVVRNADQRLGWASTALCWRSMELMCCLRRHCTAVMLAPLEELAARHVLGPRLEKAAVAAGIAVGGEAGVSDQEAAAAAAAAAAALLQEESAAEEAARRKQDKQRVKQRVAEQRAAEERQRQAEAEALQQREAEEAARRQAAEEEARRRREAEQQRQQAQQAALSEEERRLAEAQQALREAAAAGTITGDSAEESSPAQAAKPPADRQRQQHQRPQQQQQQPQQQHGGQQHSSPYYEVIAGDVFAFSGTGRGGDSGRSERRAFYSRAAEAAAAAAAAGGTGPQAVAAAVAAFQRGGYSKWRHLGPAAALHNLPPRASPEPEQQQQQQQQPQQRRQAAQQQQQGNGLPKRASSGSLEGSRRGAAGGSNQSSPAADKPRILTVPRAALTGRPSQEAEAAPAQPVPGPAGGAAPPAAPPVPAVAPPAAPPAPAVAEPAAPVGKQQPPSPVAAAAPSAADVPAGSGALAATPALADAGVLPQAIQGLSLGGAAPPPSAAPSDSWAGPAAALRIAAEGQQRLSPSPDKAPAHHAQQPAPAPATEASPPAATAVEHAPAPPGPAPGSWAALAGKARDSKPQQQQQQQQPVAAGAEAAQQNKPAAAAEAEPAAPSTAQAAWPGLGAKTAAAAAAAAAKPAPAPLKAKAGWATLGKQPAAAAAPKPADASGSSSGAAPGWGTGAGRPNFLAALAPEQAEVAALALPGLRNESGEFNCFLNVVLQCLWRCEEFRFEVLGWAPGVHQGDAVLRALQELFAELTALDIQRQDAAAAAAAGDAPPAARAAQRPLIDPTPLREAINALPGQEFKIGEMSDAGELLLVLFEHVKAAAPPAAAAAVEAAFGLQVAEAVRCTKCGMVTQEGRYTQFFYNAPTFALRHSLRVGADPGFGARLRALEDEARKTCDTDAGGCGALWPVSQALAAPPPRVFTLQLVWESHDVEPSAIASALRAVREEIDLSQLYGGVPAGAAYRLRSMVCYYGKHYFAFVRLPELQHRWVMFDDASASSVGSWAQVRQRCEAGRIQPSVLFYEAAFEPGGGGAA